MEYTGIKDLDFIIEDYKNQFENKEKMNDVMFELKFNNQYRKENIEYFFEIEDNEEILTINYKNSNIEKYFIRYTDLDNLDGGYYNETNEELNEYSFI